MQHFCVFLVKHTRGHCCHSAKLRFQWLLLEVGGVWHYATNDNEPSDCQLLCNPRGFDPPPSAGLLLLILLHLCHSCNIQHGGLRWRRTSSNSYNNNNRFYNHPQWTCGWERGGEEVQEESVPGEIVVLWLLSGVGGDDEMDQEVDEGFRSYRVWIIDCPANDGIIITTLAGRLAVPPVTLCVAT